MSDPTLESLRAVGAHRLDPVRFHYLEMLDLRMRSQPAAVQKLLSQKLHDALAAYEQNTRKLRERARSRPNPTANTRANTGLLQLNQDLNARARADASQAFTEGTESLSDLRSVRQFSQVWSQIAAEKQVTKALDGGRENAGPLNSHKLMLRSLDLMRTLSPDYLRHFWSQMDSLLWLESMNTSAATPATKPVRKARAKK